MAYVLHYLGSGLALAWILVAPGIWLDRAAAARGLWPAGDWLVRAALGIGAWVAALFAAAALGQLEPRVFRTLAFGVAGLGLVGLWRGSPRPRPSMRLERRALLALGALLAFLFVLAPVFLLAIRPTLAWDADTYHLTLPRLYLEHGGFRPVPLNVYSNWPLALELLFALGMLLDDYVTATTLHLGFGVLTTLAVYRSVLREAPAWAAVAAAAFFLGNGIVQREMGIAYVELGLAFFFLQACVWLRASFDDPAHERGWLLLTALACGMLASIKHTGAFGVLAIGLLYVLHHPRLRGSGRGMLWLGLPALALVLPWYVKSWWYTGNPVYPFLYEVFGGVDWSEALSRQHARWHASYGVGREWRALVELPFVVFSSRAASVPRFFGTLAPTWSALVPLALLLCVGRRAIALPLAAAAVYFALWALSSQQMRFLVPMLPLLAVAAGLALARLAAWLPRAWQARFGVGVAAAALALAVWSVHPSLDEARPWLRRYVHEGAALKESTVHPRWRAIERLVPAGGRILFLNTNHGFFCPRPYVADSFFEVSQVIEMLRPFASVEELERFLRAAPFTHILHYPAFRGMVYPPAVAALLADRARAVPVYRSPDGYTLYELR